MAPSRTIRSKLLALLVLPLAALIILWAYAAGSTLDQALRLSKTSTLFREVNAPALRVVSALRREYLESAEYLATRGTTDRVELTHRRVETDAALRALREAAEPREIQTAFSAEARDRFRELMAAADRLQLVRSQFDAGRLNQITLGRQYAQFPSLLERLIDSMAAGGDLPSYRQSRLNSAIGFSGYYLAREQALIAGVLAAGRAPTPAELREFTELAATRRSLFTRGMTDLRPELRAVYERLRASATYARFEQMEEYLLDGDFGRIGSHAEWRSVTDRVLQDHEQAVRDGGQALAEVVAPATRNMVVWAGAIVLLGMLAVVVSLYLAIQVGRGLAQEIAALGAAARDLAEKRLPRLMERLRRGEHVDLVADAPPLERVGTTKEIHEVAGALDTVQRSALEAAVEQVRLRDLIGQVLRNLARRSQSVVHRQLRLLDGMQRRTEDPETLEDLFRLDHLTTRMRRHAEGLIILSGGSRGRIRRQPVSAADVLQAAVAEVEDYPRVRIYPVPDVAVLGAVANDVIHLLAEIIENATVFSPPTNEVSVRAEVVGKGLAVEVEDRGLGLAPAERERLNRKLASPPDFDPSGTEQLGLVVVAALAARHGIRVELRGSPFGGTTAIVLIPAELLAVPTVSPQPVGALPGREGSA